VLKVKREPHLRGRPISYVLLMVVNSHPLWSLAWYHLPSPYFPIHPHPFPPLWPILCYNDDIQNFHLLSPEHFLFRVCLHGDKIFKSVGDLFVGHPAVPDFPEFRFLTKIKAFLCLCLIDVFFLDETLGLSSRNLGESCHPIQSAFLALQIVITVTNRPHCFRDRCRVMLYFI
jgi:hypothetical protein